MASTGNSDRFEQADKMEGNGSSVRQIEKLQTVQGDLNDGTKTTLLAAPTGGLANPAPLGLLSFASGIFLISIFGVQVRGVATPNVLIGVLIFFGGVSQFIAGIIEFIKGNTFTATLFPSYGAFNLSYALIYLPGSGIMDAYTDANTGEINEQFSQALAMYLWVWFALTVIFTVGAMRTTWILFLDLFVLDLDLLLLACGYMLNKPSLIVAGNSLGFVVAFLSCWAGTAGLFANGLVPFEIPVFPMYSGK